MRTELTAAGRRALTRCDRAVDAVERDLMSDLDDDESVELRTALHRCSRALEHEPAGRA